MNTPNAIDDKIQEYTSSDWSSDIPLKTDISEVDSLAIEMFSYNDFINSENQNLQRIVKNLKAAGVKTVCLEGAHIYSDETVSSEHLYSMKVTGFMGQFLEENGFEITNLVFIDDYHSELPPGVFDLDSYLKIAQQFGFDVDMVIFEAAMADIAEKIYETFSALGEVYKDNGKSILENPKVILINRNGNFSCPLLDTALTLVKLSQFHGTVNVLDKSYKSQQRQVRKLLKKVLGKDVKSFLSFYTKDIPKLDVAELTGTASVDNY